jgi:hypothetical protein
MNNPFEDKTNTEIIQLINDYIHSERDRRLMQRRYVDGIRFEPLSEEFDLSTVQTKRIVYKQTEVICNQMRTYSY